MSYCRWSTDNFSCDIYAYEDCHGGWTIHVAGNRHIGDCPKIEWNRLDRGEISGEEFAAQAKAQYDWLETCERREIDLPHAGDTFHEPTIEAFKKRLLELRAIGYHFPDEVLTTVDEEIREAAHA